MDNQTAEQTDSQTSRRQQTLPARTFRVLVLAVVVHSEDEGLQDEGDNDGHHHLAGHRHGLERGADVCELRGVPAASRAGSKRQSVLCPRTYHGHNVKGHEVEAAPVGGLRGYAFLETEGSNRERAPGGPGCCLLRPPRGSWHRPAFYRPFLICLRLWETQQGDLGALGLNSSVLHRTGWS